MKPEKVNKILADYYNLTKAHASACNMYMVVDKPEFIRFEFTESLDSLLPLIKKCVAQSNKSTIGMGFDELKVTHLFNQLLDSAQEQIDENHYTLQYAMALELAKVIS